MVRLLGPAVSSKGYRHYLGIIPSVARSLPLRAYWSRRPEPPPSSTDLDKLISAQSRKPSTRIQYSKAIDLALRRATMVVSPAVSRSVAALLPTPPLATVEAVDTALATALATTPDSVIIYNAAIRAYIRSHSVETAEKTLARLLNTSITPTAASFTPIIDLLLPTHPERAVRLYRRMHRLAIRPTSPQGFHTLLRIHAHLGKAPAFRATWEEMRTTGIKPSPRAHALHLQFWSAKGSVEGSLRAYADAFADAALPKMSQPLLRELAITMAEAGHLQNALHLLRLLSPVPREVRGVVLRAAILQGDAFSARRVWSISSGEAVQKVVPPAPKPVHSHTKAVSSHPRASSTPPPIATAPRHRQEEEEEDGDDLEATHHQDDWHPYTLSLPGYPKGHL